jgi:hypothetical protein
VSPVQFHELWGATNERSAEFKLALAVLEQALEDMERYQSASDGHCRRLYRNARGWLLSGDRHWPYSFANVCELLDVPAQRIRAYVLDVSAARDAEEASFQEDSGEVYAVGDEA